MNKEVVQTKLWIQIMASDSKLTRSSGFQHVKPKVDVNSLKLVPNDLWVVISSL